MNLGMTTNGNLGVLKYQSKLKRKVIMKMWMEEIFTVVIMFGMLYIVTVIMFAL